MTMHGFTRQDDDQAFAIGRASRGAAIRLGWRASAALLALGAAAAPSWAGGADAPPSMDALRHIAAEDGDAADQFGCSVDIDGSIAVVGSNKDETNGTNSGAAYVFRFDACLGDWVQEQKLLASDGSSGDQFGVTVGVSGDVIVVGAMYGGIVGFGQAYVFRYDGSDWVEEQIIAASDGGGGDGFAHSLDISGDVIVAGSYNDGVAYDAGAAYVFRHTGASWIEEAKLTASDAGFGDLFGTSVAASGDLVVVGAIHQEGNTIGSGAAYVFRFADGAWAEEAKIVSTDSADFDDFGCSAAADGDRIVIGANNNGNTGSGTQSMGPGAAYVFRDTGDGWVEEAKLVDPTGNGRDLFGDAVDIAGGTVVVGSQRDDDNGPQSGSAFVFSLDDGTGQWSQAMQILPLDGSPSDLFGSSVAATADHVIGGSYADDFSGIDSGSSYIMPSATALAAIDGDCNDNGMPDACEIAGGFAEDADGDGIPDDCDSTGGYDDANAGDADGDGDVDVDDIVFVVLQWGSDDPGADVNDDGVVDVDDVLGVVVNW